MWIGSLKDNTCQPFGLKWTSEPILALGIYFTYDRKLCNELNFYEIFKKLESVLCLWKKRNLSLYGRINIVKTLGLSKLIFNSSVLCIPNSFAAEVDKVAFNFIWNNKPANIKKRTIGGTLEEGGLNMVSFKHIDKALKLAWVKRLLDRKETLWKVIPENTLLGYGGLFLFSCDFDMMFLQTTGVPPFYEKIMYYLQEFN